jgi:hypothetical protein
MEMVVEWDTWLVDAVLLLLQDVSVLHAQGPTDRFPAHGAEMRGPTSTRIPSDNM